MLTCIKKAEEEDAIILRLLETAGKETTVKVALDENLMGKAAEAVEVDLLERPLENSTAKVVAGGVSVMVPAKGLASVKVRFR